MKINNCHLTTNPKINGDNIFTKKNLINELTYREHTNTVYHLNNIEFNEIDKNINNSVNNNKITNDNEIDNNNNNTNTN